MEALKRQWKRNALTSCPMDTKLRTDEIMAEEVGESARNVQRYIRLTELIPKILVINSSGNFAVLL